MAQTKIEWVRSPDGRLLDGRTWDEMPEVDHVR